MAPKRRNGKQQPGNPAARAAQTRPHQNLTATDDEFPNPTTKATVRAQFTHHAQTEGHQFPEPTTYDPTGPVGECWTNAYRYATTHGLAYAEGVTMMPNGWHAHAWVVQPDGTIIEPTTGYDIAHDYRGWTIGLNHITAVMGKHTIPHSSFLEAGLASGAATWHQIRDRFATTPPTSR